MKEFIATRTLVVPISKSTSLKKSRCVCDDRYYFWFFSVVTLCALSGLSCSLKDSVIGECPSHQLMKEVVPVRYLQINTPDLQPTEVFHPGEIPAVRIQSRSNVYGLLVIDNERKKIARGIELDLYPGRVFCQPFPYMTPGTYTAYIRTSGHSKEKSCSFTVLED